MYSMKYIKEYKESYFKLIGRNGYDITDADKLWDPSNSDIFIQEECDRLNELLNSDFEIAQRKRDRIFSNNFSKGNLCIVFKTKDEWYYVDLEKYNGDSLRYRCDQWDGLIKCLYSI